MTARCVQKQTHVLHHGPSNNGLNSLSINLQGTRIPSLCRVPSLHVRKTNLRQSPDSSLLHLQDLSPHQVALPSHHMLQSPPRSNSPTQIRQVDQVLQLFIQPNVLPLRVQQTQPLQLGPNRSTGIESVLVDEHEKVGEHSSFAQERQSSVVGGRPSRFR